ncbi:cytochrome P450 [Bimuria novae-zelandiae CBS 107.79]|uniref:Cytochrome P450 n=1 Tax=Bimuria novae-zelandiae CBS 107.79 TaxID=1447943 RepID=A0A6A5VLD2_9PLEO|nr:cytochrome P450 [Bimuria novae-zelandiae CBS 107.79]
MAYPTVFGRWLTAFQKLFKSEELLQEAYDKANGSSFALPIDHLKQLEKEPETILSREKALRQILGSYQSSQSTHDQKSEALRINGGVLQNKLRSSVPERSDEIRNRIEDAITREVFSKTRQSGQGEWRRIRLTPALLRIFTRVSLASFLGTDQADCPQVYTDVMMFYWTCAFAFPVVQLLPNILVPFILPIVLCMGIPRVKMYNRILHLTWRCLDENASSEQRWASALFEQNAIKLLTFAKDQKGSVVSWITEMTRVNEATEIAKLTLGLVFASAFQVPMIAQFYIHRFCSHPEYTETLREEASKHKHPPFTSLNKEMPYLDSFLKETARLSPGPIVSNPRTAMLPYTLPDGCHVTTGNWIAVPQLALMRDENLWPQAKQFEGFRFVDDEIGLSKSRLTHPSYEFPLWGSVRYSCPARFYVSIIMKMVLSHILLEYEFQLESPRSQPHINLGKFRLPNPFTILLIRKKEIVGKLRNTA